MLNLLVVWHISCHDWVLCVEPTDGLAYLLSWLGVTYSTYWWFGISLVMTGCYIFNLLMVWHISCHDWVLHIQPTDGLAYLLSWLGVTYSTYWWFGISLVMTGCYIFNLLIVWYTSCHDWALWPHHTIANNNKHNTLNMSRVWCYVILCILTHM